MFQKQHNRVMVMTSDSIGRRDSKVIQLKYKPCVAQTQCKKTKLYRIWVFVVFLAVGNVVWCDRSASERTQRLNARLPLPIITSVMIKQMQCPSANNKISVMLIMLIFMGIITAALYTPNRTKTCSRWTSFLGESNRVFQSDWCLRQSTVTKV